MKKLLSILCAFLILLVSCGKNAEDTGSSVGGDGYITEALTEVKSVAMGGGGYVTGMVIHPNNPDLMYIRTDVGGAYRWDAGKKEWIQLCNALPSAYFGVTGIAVDPNDENVVYIAAGKSDDCDVLKSEDQGKTWSHTFLHGGGFNGTGSYKMYRECIMVDPNTSDVVFCGTFGNGLLMNRKGGEMKEWVSAGLPEKSIVRSIAFDKTSFDGTKSTVAYCCVIGKGLYKTTDGGDSWSLMEGSPADVVTVVCADDGSTYLSSLSGIYKVSGDKFINISPKTDRTEFYGITVDRANSKRLAVSTWVYRETESGSEEYSPMKLPIYYTRDGGENWENITANPKRNGTVPWWPDYYFSSATASMNFSSGDKFYFTDWYGVWMTDTVSSPDRVWTNPEKGHEEMVCFSSMTTPYSGVKVYFSQADNGIIHYKNDVDTYPDRSCKSGNGQRMDYCPENPKLIFSAGGSSNSGTAGCAMYSEDGGSTWTNFNWNTSMVASDIAVSAKNSKNLVIASVDHVPYYSYDFGKTWHKSTGAPDNTYKSYWCRGDMLAADRVKPEVFYYIGIKGFYRSVDGGKTWTMTSDQINILSDAAGQVLTYDGHEGEIWVNTGKSVWYSDDFGDTWKEIEKLCGGMIALGAPKDGKKGVTLWYLGKIDKEKTALYYSADNGKTFVKLTNYKTVTFARATGIGADVKKFGRCYIATSGNGWLYVDAK